VIYNGSMCLTVGVTVNAHSSARIGAHTLNHVTKKNTKKLSEKQKGDQVVSSDFYGYFKKIVGKMEKNECVKKIIGDFFDKHGDDIKKAWKQGADQILYVYLLR